MFLAHSIVHAFILHLCTGHVPMNLDNFNLCILICVSTRFSKQDNRVSHLLVRAYSTHAHLSAALRVIAAQIAIGIADCTT
jgi:hypothetical protein